MSTDRQKPILLTAGGTGGHVFPAEALAGELIGRGLAPVLIADRRGESYGGTLGQLVTHVVPAGGLAGRGALDRLGALVRLGAGFARALVLLKRLQPRAVVGFGGYASVPAMLAAQILGIPTVLHEQNAVLGRANRLLAPRATRIATSYERVAYLTPALAAKAVLTGMPVREALLARRDDGYPAIDTDGPARILVVGGSQGARVLSEVVPSALARLPASLKKRLDLCQQCRPEDIDGVRRVYAELGIDARLQTFFTDMPERLSQAHLVISRSGASTVAELTAIGRPAILVPYLHAIDDHQTANARSVDESGAGWLIPQAGFSPESLAQRITDLFAHPDGLAAAAACARAIGRPAAARELADLVLSVARDGKGAPS
ncbi:MAG: undecaprenyldiphospho-muramoylpentapeptide beta-N-acetylglucosaminyltransferase [Rhodospirillaceae bacterium]|nr:undecaprenyldiphospho-muramoylpentapeptide beta-N-acetylglucosaminyltransferase [Rhodospirillaceae bacterium]